MSVISSMAAPTRSARIFGMLLRDAHRHGRPGPIDYLTFLQIWLLPPKLRAGLRDLVLGRRRSVAAPAGEKAPSRPARPDRREELAHDGARP